MGVGAGNRMHGIEAHGEQAGVEQCVDLIEIEQIFHEVRVVRYGIDDFHLHVFNPERSEGLQRKIARLGDMIRMNLTAALIDGLGDLFRRRPAVAGVVFDSEVALRAAGIVAGGQDDAAEGPGPADNTGDRRRREYAVLTDQDPAETVGGGDFENDLDGFAVIKASVAAHYQGLAMIARQRIEDGLDEIFQVVRLLEDRDLFPKSGCARALVVERFCGYG